MGLDVTYSGRWFTINDKQQWLHTEGITQYGHWKTDRLEEKLDAKLDKAEFYKVLTLLVALGGVVAAIVM